MNYAPTLLQLIITARSGNFRKALVKNEVTPFPLPVECVPTRPEDMWVEDIHNAVDRELGESVGFKILAECKKTPIVRDYKRRITYVVAFRADFSSEDIGLDPEKIPQFRWVTEAEIRHMSFGEESDRDTLLLAFQ